MSGEAVYVAAASREALSLPMYPELTEAQQVTIAEAIREFCGG